MIYDDILGNVKSRILESLSISSRSMEELSSILSINKTAVKEHMETLQMKGYVTSYFQGSGTGRPKKYYEITEKGLSLFPKKYIEFSKLFIEEVEKTVGSSKLNEMLENVAFRIISETGWESPELSTLDRKGKIEKLKEYVSMLNVLGYNATMDIYDDHVEIARHNCIFYDLAKTNNKIICQSLGRDLVVQSLNTDFKIRESFTEGSNKCVIDVKI